MGRSKRQRNNGKSAPAQAVAEISQDMQHSGFSGANQSLNRAQVFWPSLDTRDELDSYSHQELLRKCRWLTANVGFIKGFVKNAADLVGYLLPQSKAGDAAWEKLAEAAFKNRTESASVFDRAGKFTFKKAQVMLTRQALRDGDMLTVLAESESGGAMFGFYEAHQIRNPKANPAGWLSGVLLNKEDRHLTYGLGKDKTEAVQIAADRCIYFGNFESVGNRRAYPPLAHAVNHSLDIVETWSNVKAAIKAASLFGAVREIDSNAPTGKSKQGMPGVLNRSANPVAAGEFDVAEVWGAGQIPELPAGHKMKILHDNRPSPESQQFVKSLQEDCAYGFGLPPEVVLDISALTSAGVRFVMERAARWIEMRQMDLEDWCRRVWVYVLAKEMKAGRLPYPPEGIAWWEVEFIPQRDITIDRGREGKMKMEEVAVGLGTHSAYHRSNGDDWQDQARQRIRETKFHMDECAKEGVEYDRVFAPRAGSAPHPRQTTEPVTVTE